MKISGKNISLCFFLLLFFAFEAISQIISISPEDTLYFGRIPEGTAAVRKIGIRNLDRNPLQISDFRIEGLNASFFSILNDPGSWTINFLDRLILEIKFQPGSEGSFSGQFVVESNAASGKNKSELTGEGTDLDGGFVAFERIFGGTKSDGIGSVRQTGDGGYILAGSTQLIDREFSDATLIKMDVYGQIEWSQLYGIEYWGESFAEAISTADGGYIAVGNKADSDHNLPPDVWIVKTDASGRVEWEHTFGENEGDVASYVIQATDDSYVVAGTYQHDTAQRQDDDAFIIKLDAGGNVEWEKQYGGTAGEDAGCVQQTTDGGYIFVGSTTSYGAGEHDVYLVKLDNNGNEQWYKTYGGTDWDKASKVILTDDGGYLIVGWTANFGAQARDVYLVKTTSDGIEEWHKIYGDEHKDGASDVIQTNDGGYLVVGSLENTFFSNYWRTDAYIIKTDRSGNKMWSRTFGGLNDDGASCVREGGDGGYIIGGGANSYGNDSEVYLLKIGKHGGFSSVYSNIEVTPQSFQLEQNYPNPFNDQTRIKYHLPKNSIVHLKIYNIQGQLVSTIINQYQRSGSYNVAFSAKDLPSGLYFYQLKMDNFSDTKRMLLLK